MKRIAIWRILIAVLATTVASAVFFYWWERHYFLILSPAITEILMKWWWLAAVVMLAIVSVVGSVLILLGDRPRFLLRILLAVAGYPFPPTLVIYWLFFVERFRPNNSFKPTPLRGVGKVP